MLSRFLITGRPFILVILNQPLPPYHILTQLFNSKSCIRRIAADGGANRLLQVEKSNGGDACLIPDLICGDLDSISNETRLYYEALNVTIQKESSQDNTDFQKCLDTIEGYDVDVLAVGALGGRLDQSMASINVMYVSH